MRFYLLQALGRDFFVSWMLLAAAAQNKIVSSCIDVLCFYGLFVVALPLLLLYTSAAAAAAVIRRVVYSATYCCTNSFDKRECVFLDGRHYFSALNHD